MSSLRRLFPVFLTAVIGIVLSIMAHTLVSNYEHSKAISHFERLAIEHVVAVEEHIEITLRSIHSVAIFMESTPAVTASAYEIFSSAVLEATPDLTTLAWVPRVIDSQREQFEFDAGHVIYQGSHILEKPPAATRKLAKQRSEYFPVMYVKSRSPGIMTPGYDLATDAYLSERMAASLRTGEMVLAGRVNATVDKSKFDGVLVFIPVLNRAQATENHGQAGPGLRGYIVAVINVENTVRPLHPDLYRQDENVSGIDMYVYDAQEVDSRKLLHIYHSSQRENSVAEVLDLQEAQSGIFYPHEITVADRKWQIIARPVDGSLGLGAIWTGWIVMILVLLLTIMLLVYLCRMIRKKENIEKFSHDASRSFNDSQTQLQAIVDNFLDGLITMGANGIVQSYNKAAERIFGYKAEEVIGNNIKMLMPQPYQREHDRYLRNYHNTGEKKIIGLGREVKGKRKNDETFPLDLAVSEINVNDQQLFIGITRDITDSKQATKELDHFKYVLDNTLDMIFMFDAKSLRFNYLNRGAIENMGYTYDELLQMTPYDIKPLMTEHDFRNSIKPLLDGEQDVLHFESLHRRKDGSDFHVEILLQLVEEPGGVGRFVAFIRDITERKILEYESHQYAQALEKLHDITAASGQDFNEKIQSLLELGRKFFKLPMAIISHVEGHHYQVEYVSGLDGAPAVKSEQLLSDTCCNDVIEANSAVGYHNMQDSQHPCYKKSKLKAFIGTPLLVKGELYGTLSFAGKDARETPFSEGDFSLLRIFSQWVGNEMTRVEVEAELEDNAARLGNILNTVADAIITFNEMGIIESLNVAGSDLFGYKHGELIGKPFSILLSPEESAQYMQYLSEYLQTGESRVLGIRVEASGVMKDTSLIPIEFAVNDMLLGGRRYFTSVVRDITERKKVERMKNEFVSTVSHELRTPLTSIRGALSLVLGKMDEELSDKTRYMLDMANRNSERLTYLINDILDLEKMDAGQLEFDFQRQDFSMLIRRALEENGSFAQSHEVQLSFVDQTESVAYIYADGHRLLQVLANLISNAVKYSDKGGVVSIKLESVDNSLRVTVRNQGPGIPEEFRSRIFQRFAQADSSDTRDKGGTGLGLAITKAIVERHGGHIDYVSHKDAETEFFFDIPYWKGTSVSSQLDANMPRVLICEDNADVAEVLSSLLMHDGFISDVAVTLKDARVLLASRDYQLLLLDLMLPDGDGLPFLQEIRDSGSSSQMPVIVVSARAGEGRKEFKGDTVTIIDWIQKPVDHARLSNALEQVVHANSRPRVLHVEDDLDVVQVTRAILEDISDIDYVTSLEQARQRIATEKYDLLILDISLPDGSGLELLDIIKDCCPVVLFSGEETNKNISQKVVASLTKGRTDNAQLLKTVRKALNQSTRCEAEA